ncbi:LPXTG cell wall anchor domain-containing protein [Levilactobacillus yonginensis]
MKKFIFRLVLMFAVVLGLGMETSALARTTGSGATHVGVSFINHSPVPQKGSDGDIGVPTGHKRAKDSDNSKKTDGATVDPGNKKKRAMGTALTSAAADVVAGRLPQTSEAQMLLTSLVGIFLLIAIILAILVYRQARQLQERSEQK